MAEEAKSEEINEYLKLWFEQRAKLFTLREQKQRLESEITKINQLMRATYALVPDEEKKQFASWFEQYIAEVADHQQGLTEAIRNILQDNHLKWFSATDVRDRLQESGFDFGKYTSNPLTSIHSVLKRFKKQVKRKTLLDGTKQYRWAKPPMAALPRPASLGNLLARRPVPIPPFDTEDEGK